MADLVRGGESEEFLNNKRLQAKHIQILINERVNQIKQYEVKLERMKTVEMQQLELTIEKLQIEIETLTTNLKQIQIDDAEVIDQEA